MLFRFYYLRYTKAMSDSYADGREKFSVALLFELFAVFLKSAYLLSAAVLRCCRF